jgi:tRNA(Ile)-lysidine synthase
VLEKERVVNLIRWWLDVNKQMMPSKKTMSELYKQIKNVKKDALLNIDISDSMSIKAYRDELFLVEKTIKIDPYELIWRGEEVIELPGNSRLIFTKSLGAGFSLTKIGSKTLTIQNRNGGERFKPKNNQPTRTLKYLLQTSDIPPWKRKLMPLVFSENELVAVPDFGVHYKFQTDKEEHGWDIDWINNED